MFLPQSESLDLVASLRSVAVKSLVAPGCGGGQGGVVQQEGSQGQDADRAQGGRDEDGEDGQGEDLLSHRLPLVLPVLDAVVQEHRAQGRLHRRLRHPGEGHEDLLLGVESPARHGEVRADHPANILVFYHSHPGNLES